MSLIDFFTMGGPLMWPLLGLGLLGPGIVLERAIYFATTYFPLAVVEAEAAVEAEALGEIQTPRLHRLLPGANLRRAASPWQRIVSAFFAHRSAPPGVRDAHLTRLGSALIEEMRRRVGVLAMIATVAPLIGLLGTIGGMMLAFQEIAATGGQADIALLANGLWVAMITTFAGLTVAIPAHVAHGWLQSLVRGRIAGMNSLLKFLEERDMSGAARFAEAS